MGVQQLNLNSYDIQVNTGQTALEKTEPRFFRRQFQSEVTHRQRLFDWTFGVVLPVICFFSDPIVFRPVDSMLGAFKYPAYILSFCAVMGVMAFLIFGEKLRSLTAPLSGLFFASSIISLGIGVAILPISVLGSIILIGAMGFTPFFTSFVLLRNGKRAYQMAERKTGEVLAWRVCLLSLVLSVCLPIAFGGVNISSKGVRGNLEAAQVWMNILGLGKRS
jgi:hypothetical protein